MIQTEGWCARAQAGGQGRGCAMQQEVVIADPKTNVYMGKRVKGQLFFNTTLKCEH